jgi:glycosyltransferase involved in cell wall biosynthesis
MTWPRAPLLMVSSSSRTGPAEGLISLARELRAQGLDARFAGDTVRPGENLGEHLAHAGVPWETELRLSRKVRPLDVIHDVGALARGPYDVLHAAFAHDHLVALLAAWRARKPGLRVVRAAQRRLDLAPGFFGKRLWALRRSDGVLVHCESYRKLLVKHLPAERVACVFGSVEAGVFTPGRASGLRARWGIPAEAPLAGIVARMKPERGHRALLEGFAAALREVPDAWLVLVGRGEDEQPLRAVARKLAVGDRVVFGGYLRGPGLIEAYRALDVAVWLREGNDGACRGVLEAMACGLPVIAGAEGAPGELVRDGLDGRIVAPADTAAIARALSDLLRDLHQARALGRSARERAQTFTPQRAAAETLAFWRRLRDLPPP